MRTLAILSGVFALFLAGCGGRADRSTFPAGRTATDALTTPRSVSPGSIAVAPMVHTTAQPPSAMTSVRVPKAAINGLSWTQVPGAAIQVVASPDGSFWALSLQSPNGGADRYIWHYANGSWTNVPGAAAHLAIAPNGTLWAINAQGGIYSYNGTWSGIAGGASDITVTADGSVYVISSTPGTAVGNGIWRFAGGAWTQLSGAAVRLVAAIDGGTYVVPGGTILPNGFYAINGRGDIYYNNAGNGWVALTGGAHDLAPAKNGGLFVLGFPAANGAYPIYYLNLANSVWTQQGGGASSISTDGAHLYAVGAGNGIYSSPVTLQAAPAVGVGYLNASGGGFFSGILTQAATGATVVGISTTEIGGRGPALPIATAPVSFTVSGAGTFSSKRSEKSAASWLYTVPATLPIDRPVMEPADFEALRAKLRRADGQRGTLAVRRTQTLPTTLGSTANIWVQNSSIGTNNGSYRQIPATLAYVSTNGYIWVGNSLLSTSSPTPGPVTPSIAQAIGAAFDNAYASDTAHYGSPNYTANAPGLVSQYYTCDATGYPTGSGPAFIVPTDQKINVFVGDMAAGNFGNGVGGYFNAVDYLPQAILNCSIGSSYTAQTVPRSNETPIVYVGYATANGAQYETQEDLVRGTAHELQHLINFVNHLIIHNGRSEDSWIDEGMAMLAQDLAVNRMYPGQPHDIDDAGYHAHTYLVAPDQYSISGFAGIVNGAEQYNCGPCYGAEFLFQRYLYDRFGGDTYLHAMLGSNFSFANLRQATGVDPQTLLGDFAIALAASGRNTTDPRYGFSSLNLLTPYTDQFGYSHTIGGPTPVSSLGGSFTGSYMKGAFVYLTVGSPSGSFVTAADSTGGFGLLGGVVQY